MARVGMIAVRFHAVPQVDAARARRRYGARRPVPDA
jgi:hypothetical protein